MFDFLKKKVSGFVQSIVGKKSSEKKEKVSEEDKIIEMKEEKREKESKEKTKKEKKEKEKKEGKKVEEKVKEKEKKEEKKEEKPKVEKEEKKKRDDKSTEKIKKEEKEKTKEEKKTRVVRKSIVHKVGEFLSGEVELGEEEIENFVDEFELSLLESDVSLESAEFIRETLRSKLAGKKVKKGRLKEFLFSSLKETLKDAMDSGKEFDFVDFVKEKEKPVKILFLGTNGAGKTTTMAKIANLLLKEGYSVLFAAADTFRAAAIEQLSVHANNLGIKLIKRQYGADPTSVAYDAVAHAKANGIDVVLIDTAGRQETNYNLVNELKKMVRVIKPDLKLYVGESIAGQSLIEQVKSFNEEIGVDGVILTKLDCDAKGGTILSVYRSTGVPILYLGTGQGYSDLEKFSPKRIAERILS